MAEETRDFGSVLDRWHRRMLRSHSFYASGVFEDEQFENLVAVLVTATYIEVLLWMGVQFAGYRVRERGKKTLTLGPLIRRAKNYGIIGKPVKRLLKEFNDIRNESAHNIDYSLTFDTVNSLRSLLPDANEQAIRAALVNILPSASDNLVARLVFEQIAQLVYSAVRTFALGIAEAAPS